MTSNDAGPESNRDRTSAVEQLRRREGGHRDLWEVAADLVTQLVEQAIEDPDHPWTQRWPSLREMADQIGVGHSTMQKVLLHLGDPGLLVKADVPWRDKGAKKMWVPKVREAAYPARPTEDQMIATIMEQTLSGAWPTLPPVYEMAAHLGVDRGVVTEVMRTLERRHLAAKLHVNGKQQWRIVMPHQARKIDPRRTVPTARWITADLVRRIRAGEFRYRLPGRSRVWERPFLSVAEMAGTYHVTGRTATGARDRLVALGLLVPGPQANTAYRLAPGVEPVDRARHPAPRAWRKSERERAREITDDLVRRIRAGEFRYRLVGDDTVYERPFLSRKDVIREYHTQSGLGWARLVELGMITPSKESKLRWHLADHIDPVDRAQHPAPRVWRKTVADRADEIKTDLLARVQAGEFTPATFPRLRELRGIYHAEGRVIGSVVEDLVAQGWLVIRRPGKGTKRFVSLADTACFGQCTQPD